MYQGNNPGNFYIHPCAKKLPTAMKAVINYVLASNIANDHFGVRIIFLKHWYACPELFEILSEDLNLILGGTYRKNRIGFPGNDELLTLTKVVERGTYWRLFNRHFLIVATSWKDSKTLQFISILRKTIIMEVSRRRGSGIHQVVRPEYLTGYHHNMNGVERGVQLREQSPSFSKNETL